MANQTRRDNFLSILGGLGGSAGNGKLRETLGWNEETYEAVKQALLVDGAIALGRGRGGSVALADHERPASVEQIARPANEPADNAVPTSIRSEEAVVRVAGPRQRKLTLQQLEAHLWGAPNILAGKNSGPGLQELYFIPDVL